MQKISLKMLENLKYAKNFYFEIFIIKRNNVKKSRMYIILINIREKI